MGYTLSDKILIMESLLWSYQGYLLFFCKWNPFYFLSENYSQIWDEFTQHIHFWWTATHTPLDTVYILFEAFFFVCVKMIKLFEVAELGGTFCFCMFIDLV
jgi:hypothetical protein